MKRGTSFASVNLLKRITWYWFRLLFFSSNHNFYFLLSGLTRRGLYPQRSSGQAVIAGVTPFPPRPVRAFLVPRRVQHSRCSSIFIECCQLTLSRFPLIDFYARKSPYEHALGETRTHEIDLDRHADHLPRHRGRQTYNKRLVFISMSKRSVYFRREGCLVSLEHRTYAVYNMFSLHTAVCDRRV